MTLTLTLSNPEILPDTHRTHTVEFGEKGGVMGRNKDCTWCLEDPERFVSSRHAVVGFGGSGFYIEDVSTNGTYLNDQLIGKGKKKPITTGDTLRVGRFVITAQERNADGSVKGEKKTGQDPFNMDSPKEDEGPQDLLAATHIGSGGIDEFLGGAKKGPLSGGSLIPSSDNYKPSIPNHSPGINEALPPTLPTDGGDHAIPEDWWKRGPENKAKPVVPDPNPKAAPSTPLDDPLGLNAKATPVPPELEPDYVAPAAKVESPTPKPKAEPVAAAPEPKVVKPSAPKPLPKPVVTEALTAAAGDQDFAVNFLLALEADPSTINEASPEILGAVMKELLGGILDLIAARGAMRNELRLSATMIGARENNPLKFSINHRDALNRLLTGESAGFMAPIPATAEVMGDLKHHQFATMAGIDAGIKALLDAMDPEKAPGGKGPLAGVTGMSALKAKHQALKQETQERSDGTFWRAFGKAYDDAAAAARSNRSRKS